MVDILSIILRRVSEHDRVLDQMNGNVEFMKWIIGFPSRSVQLIEKSMNYELPHLHPIKQLRLPSDTAQVPMMESE